MTEDDDAASSPDPAPPTTWMDRHGAVLLSGALGLVLVLVLVVDRLIRR